MPAQWYYQVMGDVVGPVSPKDLRDLAGMGKIQKETLVRRGEGDDWRLAEEVRSLFSGPAAQTSPATKSPPPPDVEALVEESRESTDWDPEEVAVTTTRRTARPVKKKLPKPFPVLRAVSILYRVFAVLLELFGVYSLLSAESMSESEVLAFLSITSAAGLMNAIGEVILVLLAIERNGRETTANISQFLTVIQER